MNTRKNKNNNATTAKLSGKVSSIVVSELQKLQIIEGTEWLVRARLERCGESVFISPELEYAGKSYFEALYLKDWFDYHEEPMGLSYEQLLELKDERQYEEQEATRMQAILDQISFAGMVSVLTKKIHSIDHHFKKAVGGRFILVGFDYPKDEELDIVFLGEKEGSFIEVSTEEPRHPHEARQRDLIKKIVGARPGGVLLPIFPGKNS